jgi:hypothetical protein
MCGFRARNGKAAASVAEEMESIARRDGRKVPIGHTQVSAIITCFGSIIISMFSEYCLHP